MLDIGVLLETKIKECSTMKTKSKFTIGALEQFIAAEWQLADTIEKRKGIPLEIRLEMNGRRTILRQLREKFL